MSKAILVMDMPTKCIECPCCNIGALYDICRVLNKTTNCVDIRKPDWCPLKSEPQKRTDDWGSWFNGYNACIDDILKGSEEE